MPSKIIQKYYDWKFCKLMQDIIKHQIIIQQLEDYAYLASVTLVVFCSIDIPATHSINLIMDTSIKHSPPL